MANRIIKESICESEKLAKLTDFEFRLWVGLIISADDMGRGDARPAIIKGKVFPLRERVTIKDIDDALHRLAAKRCVSLYKVGGKPYYWFPSWTEHQRVREVKPRFPAPEEAEGQNDGENSSLRQSAAICGNLPQSAANCGEPPQKEKEEKERENEKERSKEKDKEKDKEEIETTHSSAYTREDEGGEADNLKRFVKPTIANVIAYCQERRNGINAQKFWDYHESKGWIVGRAPMKDWKAAVRTWEGNERERQAQASTGGNQQPQKNGSFDVNEFFARAVARTYKNMNIEEETK